MLKATLIQTDASTMHERRPTLVNVPPSRWPSLNLGEIWRYRDLLWLLTWRDFSAKYRQSVLGITWAVIRPLVTVAVFSIIFGYVARLPSDGIPYPLFAYSALLPWNYFATCLTQSTNSLVGGRNLLTKVYFPRMILPLSTTFSGLVDVAIQFVILGGMLMWFGVSVHWGVLLLPLFLLQAVLAALAVGVWLTALNVKYRDVSQGVTFLSQTWMYLTPIVYSSSLIPERWRLVYGLNPMVGVVEGFRWAVAGREAPDWMMMGVSMSVVLLMLIGGLYHFRRVESTFADII